jgi:hypothetical protein
MVNSIDLDNVTLSTESNNATFTLTSDSTLTIYIAGDEGEFGG